MSDAEPTTAIATDRLLEALAVATDSEQHLEELVAGCKPAMFLAQVAGRTDLFNLWFAFAELACAVAMDHATEGARP